MPRLGALFNATNPDPNQFKAWGGKLIQYHGWSDPGYYAAEQHQLLRERGRVQRARSAHTDCADTKTFYWLFMVL